MKDSVKVRQVCFILFAYNAASKLLLYPTAAASAAGSDLLFPALINLILQSVIIWSVAYLSSRTDETFFGLMRNTFGEVTARVVYALFALYFLLSAIVPVNEQQLFVHGAFYDTVPAIVIFLPFFFFSVYAGAKGFTNVGRCADVCFIIFIIAALALLVMSAGSGDYSNLLPVLGQPLKKTAGFSLASLFRYSESAFLLMFMGHYKYQKGDAAKLTVSYVAGGLVVVAFMAVFYAVYGGVATTRSFMLNNIAVFFPAVGYVGRVDLFIVYFFDIVALFATVLNIQMCVHCLCKTFNRQNSAPFSLAVNAVLVAVTFIVNNKFTLLQDAASKWFFIPAVIFAYALPVLCWALRRKKT